jgi:nitrate reductase gamma subunit
MKITFLFEIWPYLTLGMLVLGFVARFALTGRDAPLFAADLARARALFRFGPLWRLAVVVLLVAHFAGLVVPRSIVVWNEAPLRLLLLEGIGFAVGLVALGGWVVVTWRHLTQSDGSLAGEIADSLFLSVSLVALLSGLLTAALYRWGSSWGTAILTPYALSLLRRTPNAGFVTQMPFLVQLHVFSAFAVAGVFPFSGAATFAIAALQRLLGWAGRPFAAGGRSAEAWLRRHNPAAWIWPEED